MRIASFIASSVFLVVSVDASAQQPPRGSTALCADGTYSDAKTRASACHGHKGVKRWLGAETPAVQNQSPAVSATGVAPTTGEPSRTPASAASRTASSSR